MRMRRLVLRKRRKRREITWGVILWMYTHTHAGVRTQTILPAVSGAMYHMKSDFQIHERPYLTCAQTILPFPWVLEQRITRQLRSCPGRQY